MSDFLIPVIALCAGLALVALGGGLYEFSVIDPACRAGPISFSPAVAGFPFVQPWRKAKSWKNDEASYREDQAQPLELIDLLNLEHCEPSKIPAAAWPCDH
jgi:hypothetical protein